MFALSGIPPLNTDATDDAYQKLLDDLKKSLNDGSYSEALAQIFQNIAQQNLDYATWVNLALQFATLAVPELGILTPFIGVFFTLLNNSNTTPPPTITDIFNALKPAIQDMIDAALTETEISYLDGVAEGLQGLLQDYQREMNFITNAGGFSHVDTGALDRFYRAYTNVDAFMTHDLPTFVSDVRFEDIGLPYYAIFASIHLMLLSDGIANGASWYPAKFTKDAIASMQIDLRQKINLYSNKITTTFLAALALPKYGGDGTNINLSPNDPIAFSKQKKFISGVTINCLDLAKMFPTFDKSSYPNDSNNLEQTRLLLSPPVVGLDSLKNLNFSNWPYYNNGWVSFGASNGRELTKLEFYNYHDQTDIVTQITAMDTLGETHTFGFLTGGDYGKAPDIFDNINQDPIVAFSTNYDPGTYGYGFGLVSGAIKSFGGGGNTGDDSNELKHTYIAPAEHKISYIYPSVTDEFIPFSSYVCVSTPIDLTGTLTFGEVDSDNDDAIIGKGIPAEAGKWCHACDNSDDAAIPIENVALEWINGANAVKVEYGAFLTIKATNLTAGTYHVRVRYANPSNNPVNLYQEVWAGDTKIQGGGWALPSTAKPNSNEVVYVTGQNGNYVLQDISWPTGGNAGDPLNLPSGEVKVKLSGLNPGDSVYVDRIEFIPVTDEQTLKNINYTITSPIPSCTGDVSSYQSIWAGSGKAFMNASVTIQGLPPHLYSLGLLFFGKTIDDTWEPLSTPETNIFGNGGPYNLMPANNSQTPFIEIAICSGGSDGDATSGTITGTVS